MKTLSLVLLASLSIVCGLDARIVTLTVGDNKTNDSLTIGTNESLTIISAGGYPGGGAMLIEKDGARIEYGVFNYDPANAKVNPRVTIAGPVTVSILQRDPNPFNLLSFLTIDVQSDLSPPDKTFVVPQGSGAIISLESSTNLVNWAPFKPGPFKSETANTFFRIRADRIPPKPE